MQGLRAIAVLLVALNHAGLRLIPGGYIGVDVFFVVSGFLITGLLIRDAEATGRVNWRDFYARRARRLLPAAGLTLIGTGIAAVLLLNFLRAQAVLHDSVWAAFFSANIHFARVGSNYFNRDLPPSPLLHFWSLAVEEQFYLVWPLVLSVTVFGRQTFRRGGPRPRNRSINLRRLAAVLVGTICVSLAWSAIQTSVDQTSAYFSTLTRAWELAAGALVAVLASRGAFSKSLARGGVIGWIGIIAILAAATLYSPATPFPGFAAALPVVGTVLVLIGGLWSDQNGPGRVLSLRPMTFVGDVSYGFYLAHWPLLVIASQYEGRALGPRTNMMLLLVAFAIAVGSFYAVERPLRRPGWAMRWEPSDGLALWPITILCLTLVLMWGLQSTQAASAAQTLTASVARGSPKTSTTPLPSPDQGPAPTTPAALLQGSAAEAKVRDAVALAGVDGPLPALMQPSFAQLEGGERADPRRIQACQATKDQSVGKICPEGGVGAKKKVVLLGNSHAGMWVHVMSAIAQQSNYELIPLLKESCGIENFTGLDSMEACAPWFDWALSEIGSLHPDVVVLAITYTPSWATATAAALAQLKAQSPRVVLLGDVPGLEKRPADCLLGKDATMRSCTFRPLAYFPRANAAAPAIAQAAGAEFVDTQPWFCAGGFCPSVVGTTITYSDTNHVSIAYSFDLTEPLASAIGLR